MDIGEALEAGLVIGWFLLVFWLCWQLLKFSVQLAGACLGFNFGLAEDGDFWHPLYAVTAWVLLGGTYLLFTWIF